MPTVDYESQSDLAMRVGQTFAANGFDFDGSIICGSCVLTLLDLDRVPNDLDIIANPPAFKQMVENERTPGGTWVSKTGAKIGFQALTSVGRPEPDQLPLDIGSPSLVRGKARFIDQLKRAQVVKCGSVLINIMSPMELYLTKKYSKRDQDKADAVVLEDFFQQPGNPYYISH